MKELEDKVVVDVQYDFNKDEENEAFRKLRRAAKAYDRSHPASLGDNTLTIHPINTFYQHILSIHRISIPYNAPINSHPLTHP